MSTDGIMYNPEDYREIDRLKSLIVFINRASILVIVVIIAIIAVSGYKDPDNLLLSAMINFLVGFVWYLVKATIIDLLYSRAKLLEETIKIRVLTEKLLRNERAKTE